MTDGCPMGIAAERGDGGTPSEAALPAVIPVGGTRDTAESDSRRSSQ
jgi:hypothetical protein